MKLSERIDWNDLRLLLTIAETGTVSTAAHSMNIDPTTVTRRLRRLEQKVQVKLIERIRSGVVLSNECKGLIEAASHMDRALDDVASDLSSSQQLSGVVRITMTSYMAMLISEPLAELQITYPELFLDIRESALNQSLENKEADIAIRFGHSPNEGLVGTRHMLPHSVWGLPQFALQQSQWPWIAWNLQNISVDRWIDNNDPNGKIVMRLGSIISQSQMAKHGVGVALLPDIWVNNRSELSELIKVREGLDLTTWVLTLDELRKVPKIQLVMQKIRSYLKQALSAPVSNSILQN